MATGSAGLAICSEKKLLTDELVKAVRALTGLQEAQTAHLVRVGESLPRVETALKVARMRWDNAKIAYLNHVQMHGC
jgi:hypothetical protein